MWERVRHSSFHLRCVAIDISVTGEESSQVLGARDRVSCSAGFTLMWSYIKSSNLTLRRGWRPPWASGLWWGMTDVEADFVCSGKVPRARVSVFWSVRCTVRIGLWKDFGFLSDGRASAGLRLIITVKWGWCQWLQWRGRSKRHGCG